jgi:ABC-type lipoprotein release transport system permease subunit
MIVVVRGTSAGTLWSKGDIRSRLASLVVLGVLAGLTIGVATAAFDGARRTDSALTRLRERTNASDAVVFATQADLITPDWTKLSHRPEVAKVIRWALAFGTIDGDPDGVLFMPVDDVWLNQVDHPIVVAGRMFDPRAADEIVVTDDVPYNNGKMPKVGDTLPFAPAPIDPTSDAAPPPVTMHVVGIIHTPLSYVFTGGGFLSPGFRDKYGGVASIAENALIKLAHGPAEIGLLRRDASTDVAEGVPVLDFHVTARRVTATTDVEGAMLRLLAAIVALAGFAFIGQALARSAATIASDAPTLRALGMTKRELVLAAMRPHVITFAVAVVVATFTAVVASRWFPVGLAAQVDPDRGIRVSVVTIAIAVVVALLLTVTVAVAGAARAARSTDQRVARRGAWSSLLPVARPVVARIGTRFAFESGGVKRKASAWPALIGAAAAVAGVVAIVTVNNGLANAIDHPEVAGVAWDATVVPKQDDITLDSGVRSAVVEKIAHQPGVEAVSSIGRYVTQIGDLGVPVFTVVDPNTGPTVRIVTLSGRAPERDDEIVLGPSTARDLGVRTGDDVDLADGSSAKVVGLGLFPSDVHAQFDEGAWVTPPRWSRLAAPSYDASDNQTVGMLVAVRFSDHHHTDAQIAALSSAMGSSVETVLAVDKPSELTNLHNVRTLPTVLAVFLAVLGAVAVGHALFSSVHRRKRDFAVMESLGVTRGGVRAIITTQATVVAIAGVVVGVPVGLIAGRAGWQAITDRVPLTFRSPFTALSVLAVVPIALLAVNMLAIVPARRASNVKPALVLRSE